MNLVQILDCNSELKNCCSNYALAASLDICRKVINLVQIIVPIILIITAMWQLFLLIQDPERKGGLKSLYNKFYAAVFIFMLPLIVEAVLGILPDNFSLATCFEEGKTINEIARSTTNDYVSKNKKRTSPLLDPDDYKVGSSINTVVGSIKAQAIVTYAKKFVGQRYVYGGSWNGEEPYTPTDCSGFVRGVFAHHGISLSRTVSTIWADTSKYTKVNPNDIRPGDLVVYEGHIGILTGNGKEIVHAKGKKYGVVLDSNYQTCSKKSIRSIIRINGVN